jgi:hypothetical protein
MLWEVIVPGDEEGQLASSITVEADNWFSALRSGLTKHGLDGQLVSNLTCDIKADRSVHVTDFVTRKIYMLRPVAGGPARKSAPPLPAPEPAAAPAPEPPAVPAPEPAAPAEPAVEPPATGAGGVIPDLPADMPRHEVFFWQDEAPPDGSGIFYRERLVSVAPDTPEEEAGRLAMAIFDRLKAMGSDPGTKLFVNVQVFDHKFKDRSQRPAIAAATWKEWSPKKARVQFPLSGAEAVTFSQIPQAPWSPPPPPPMAEEASPQPEAKAAAPVEPAEEPPPAEPPAPPAPTVQTSAPAAPPVMPFTPLVPTEEPTPEPEAQPIDLTPPPAPEPAAVEPPAQPVAVPEPVAPRPATPEPVAPPPRAPTPLPPSPSLARGSDVEDKIVEAFERMQELFTLRDHDDVARFALQVSREFIDCEAGSSMLITPGKYELYVAAAEGEVAGTIAGKKLSLTKGIVGFATRAGAVVTVSDPENDPRFHAEFDELSGFETKNVVCAPIQYEGRTIGAIELINSPREAGFRQSEANVLSYIAGAVGEYIDTSLPSREADFSDREFAEFLPQKKPAAKGGKPGKKKIASAARKKKTKKKTASKAPARKKAASKGTATKKSKATGKKKPARKKKRKR